MKKEIDEFGTLWKDIYTDKDGRKWDLLEREGGSLSLYTRDVPYVAVGVVYDTCAPVVYFPDRADEMMADMREIYLAIGKLLESVSADGSPITNEPLINEGTRVTTI